LNNYQIKVLAAILMLVDHVGAIFFPTVGIFRVIGRFSFPLFIVLLVDGEQYTHNFRQYCLRLLVLGIASQPIFGLLFPLSGWNILFTLLLGLFCLRLVRLFPRWQLLIWVLGSILAQVLSLEYGAYGLVAIALIHSLRTSIIWLAGWIALHLGLLIFIPNFSNLQFLTVLAPLLLRFANHQPGKKARWFYLFYPLHLLILWLLSNSWL